MGLMRREVRFDGNFISSQMGNSIDSRYSTVIISSLNIKIDVSFCPHVLSFSHICVMNSNMIEYVEY
jgi:hypothetical protein